MKTEAIKKAEEISESFRTARSFSRHPSDIAYSAAIEMADWKDQHPKKGLWDAEKVCKYLEEHASNFMGLENDEEGELQTVFYQKGLVDNLRKAMEDRQ